MQDALRAVTKASSEFLVIFIMVKLCLRVCVLSVKEARLKEIRTEILNSKRLQVRPDSVFRLYNFEACLHGLFQAVQYSRARPSFIFT